MTEHAYTGSFRRFQFRRTYVGGLPVAVLDRRSTARLTIAAAIARRGTDLPPLFFTTINGQVVSLCASRVEIRQLFERADLISADGMSVVFASRLGSGEALPERVATTDAFHDAAMLAVDRGARFYFLGAKEDVTSAAVKRASELYPELQIVGHRSGYFRREEESEVVKDIDAVSPDVLWVGLGVPLQQQFVMRNLPRLTRVGVIKSCGGLFDFLAGKAPRAPNWMQLAGLEWAYRAWRDPKRLAWRYLTTNPHAAYWLLRSNRSATDGAIEMAADL
jgi:exopolysaccharide biosynthesis WecB/TagA/CpsF family protein